MIDFRHPQATLEPFLDMMRYINKIKQCSVHSINSSFILFMVSIASMSALIASVARSTTYATIPQKN